MALDLQETFWLKINYKDFIEVDRNRFIEAERAAGFEPKCGSDDVLATGGFSVHTHVGSLQGEIRPSSQFSDAVRINSKPEKKLGALYVVRWMSREFEPGRGVDDVEEFFEVFKNIEDAKVSVEERFEKIGKRSLYGAGDYFIYPSGPDHEYHVYEVPVNEGHKIFDVIDDMGMMIPRLPRDEKVIEFRQELISRMQSEEHSTRHRISFYGLHPKPMQSVGHYSFPKRNNLNWVDLGVPKLK